MAFDGETDISIFNDKEMSILADYFTSMHILCNQMGHASGNVTQKYYLGNSKEGLEMLRNNLNKMK